MPLLNLPWSLTGALLATAYFHSLCTASSPAINVALKASFSSAPYLLELLETVAEENATSYFPLLDRIADGHFAKSSTDQELYTEFLKVLREDGHMADAETLSSYQFALSMRSSAPRIEAHYQYYHTATEPALKEEQDTSCPVWVLFNGKQYCSPSLDSPHGDVNVKSQLQELPFDRILGNPTAPASILYADITSPTFGLFHKTLSRTAREGKTSYRIRHRKSLTAKSKPLIIPGYGVELALKRTDYIVIDDRNGDDSAKRISETEVKLEDEEIADLKPLSTSELVGLSLKASSFVLESDNPLDTLVKISQDFPKYSSALAAHNPAEDFLREHEYNREQLVPAGMNVWWMNGVQMIEKDIESLTLLDILRRERKLINGVRDLGFTGLEAVELLGHDEISIPKAENEPQRFDWRDEIEGGNVIIWMNNLEKDKRYEGWPDTIQAILQRTYPGQLPSVRKDIFNMVIPISFSDANDVVTVVEVLQGFIKRKAALRVGLVPLTKTAAAVKQAKVVYHLLETYGLSSAIAYLEASLSANSLAKPSKSVFEAAIEGRKIKNDHTAASLEDVLNTDTYNKKIAASRSWVARLAVDSEISPFFIDGVALPRDETWLQSMGGRVHSDLQSLQKAVYGEVFTSEWAPEFFLSQAAKRRNPIILPEDEKTIKIFDVNKLATEHKAVFDSLPRLAADSTSGKADWAHLILVADLTTEEGWTLLTTAIKFREANTSVELVIVHNPAIAGAGFSVTDSLFTHSKEQPGKPFDTIQSLKSLLKWDGTLEGSGVREAAGEYWRAATSFIDAVTLEPGQSALLLNGRLVGPIPDATTFVPEDFEQLLSYERSRRIQPAFAAVEAMGLSEKLTDPLSGAKLSSIVAISTISDVPEGMFEQPSTLRMNQFNIWNTTHTTIEIGDSSTATVHVNVLVDPTSEQGQRWIPMLKVMSELEGVFTRIYLNPKERLQELPIKRFYRYVLDSKPTFNDDGSVKPLGASFKGVPQEALLTVGLDIPPAWLVAPKVSAYDLDNIKLSSIKTDVEALYELEHILIEGHSREIPGGAAPRGAQLVLATERDPHFADTIIMANLGYFQFKANPGLYKINLQEGRSSEIFEVSSLGSKGWRPSPGDDIPEVVLMSFQGTTLYPRLSRRAGMEAEDVLELKVESAAMDFVSRGLNFAQGIISGKGKGIKKQADINIFSVASGHLYERMLNIMMVSVMKHTKHTVKFWFIEQFLSPSFKDFIPFLAAEYGFEYEMVTFKWPHWLRAQTEKQREIWGYKILFLDVLFPLSLDKVIFVDADQIVRTDMIDLVNHDLEGAPYGFTPMCDSRVEMEGFRFWKQGYWKNFLRGLPYHISALYVVDLHRFRQMAAGDRLRQQYHQLSADPNSLSNLDQDLPNHMQSILKIHSLPQEWLWCETWCSDESQEKAKTIDLCNNPQTKEPKLDRARRQVPEWTVYDDEIAAVDRKRKGSEEAPSLKNTKSRNHEEVKTNTRDEL
ncbi:udp-glucose:glycoprotein glucosyltransferase [Phlyctema vagabunda]|uniref:Udp-glucose:glycoprotein glucosyltransferase n=1 Tax=Phlyctema vagabunda TaxID=108571 RepID=A0ABR4PRX5_9HELO